MKNKYLIVGNLKMNMDIHDIALYLKEINKFENENLVICPTSIYTPYFLKQKYKVGIQNIFYKSEGSYTGEISPLQASKMGIEYVIIGHSERRLYFSEDDIDVNKKVLECLKYGLKVILCIGETNEEKDMLKTSKVLKKQLLYGLRNVTNLENVYIAYEPVWAIGTNVIPNNNDLEKSILYIRETIYKNFNANNVNVLYGGSVNDENIKELKKIKILDGFLIGNSSCNPEKLRKIIDILDVE